jgi:hypothetical protein
MIRLAYSFPCLAGLCLGGIATCSGPHGSSGAGTYLIEVPSPAFQAATRAPGDAGTIDSYTPPLPPLPDGSVPADSRMEPR